MSDATTKISELNALAAGNMAAVVPTSLTLSSGSLSTNKLTLGQIRDLFDFTSAYSTLADGITNTVSGQLFYVYTDDSQLQVTEYSRTDSGASVVLRSDGSKKNILIPAILKHIQVQVDSVAELRTFKPWFEGQIVYLNGYASVGDGGGGLLRGSLSATTDDNGINFAGGTGSWKRIVLADGKILAGWFGVTHDGVACGTQISNAIDYISINGGTLRFGEGEVNFGTLRKVVSYSATLVPFTIEGCGTGTLFTWDDVPPPTLASGQNWVKESPLLSFIGNSGTQYIPRVVLRDFNMDYSRQVNKGGTDLATLGVTHPTPYSLGVWAIYFYYADSPLLERINMSNVYGDGFVVRKTYDPVSRDCQFTNVSAGNIIARTDGNMASDSNGGAIFYWACVGGLIENCVAWNNRLYQVHVNSTDNGTDVYQTLCGYIAFWTEYGWDQNMTATTPETAPPRMTSIVSTANLAAYWDNEAKGTTIRNCIAYGYTIGIKSEGFSETNIANNMVLNCYLPIFPASTRATVSDNFTDMLYCDNRTCPQGGYQTVRGHLVAHNYSTTDDGARRGVEFRGNKCYVTNYPAFRSNRSGTLFVSNMFRFARGAAFPIDTTIAALVTGVIIKDNTFFFDSTISSATTANIAYHDGLVFSGNRFVNKSSTLITLGFRNTSKNMHIENNFFEGWFFVAVQGTATVEKNTFDVQTAINSVYHTGNVFQATARAYIARNEFRINSSATTPQIVVSTGNSRFEANNINVQDTGAVVFNGLVSSQASAAGQVFTGNVVTNNPYNTPMFYLTGSHYPTFIENVTSGPLTAVFNSVIYAPITMERNRCTALFSVTMAEKNTNANLSSQVTPYVGMRMNYLAPAAGGAEGEVYTGTAWKTFGSISA